jgi:pyruvate-formate lyase-activating enzyme
MKRIKKLGFDIVSGCQLECVGCPNSLSREPMRQITPAEFGECLKNIDVRVGTFRLYNFGEPLLHKNLYEILVALKAWGRAERIEASTNAQVPLNAGIVRAFNYQAINKLAISADGDGTRESYEQLRPPGKFDRMHRFVRETSQLLRHPKMLARISLPPHINDDDAKMRWTEFFGQYGVSCLFRHYHHLPGSRLNLSGKTLKTRTAGACSYIKKENLYIQASGQVVPCCVHSGAFFLGSIFTDRASSLLKTKRGYADTMKKHRTHTTCQECQF